MRIVPVFYPKSLGVVYATGATKVEYNRIWERTLGVLRERYPHFKFHATKGTESFSVQLHVGTVAASEAVAYYTVSKGYAPTVQLHIPAISDVKQIVDLFVDGIVGVLKEVYPEYFTVRQVTDVFEMVDRLASTEHRCGSRTSKLVTWPKRLSALPSGGSGGGISD